MPTSQPGDLMTVREAASLLKISPVTIKRWLKQGRLRAYHVGPRAVRIKHEDIEALLMPTTGASAHAEYKEVPAMLSPAHEHAQPRQPQAGERARRQQLVATIRARRTQRVIAPMTAAQLIQAAREEGERDADQEVDQEHNHAAE